MKKLAIVLGAIFIFTVSANILCSGEENIINGCYQKKNGQLRIVSNPGMCNKSEIPLSWNLKGPQGPVGPTGPQGPVGSQGPPGGVHVFDANGQYLGILLGAGLSGGAIGVFVPTLSRSVTVGYTGMVYSRELLFETNNCTGTPYSSSNQTYEIF